MWGGTEEDPYLGHSGILSALVWKHLELRAWLKNELIKLKDP